MTTPDLGGEPRIEVVKRVVPFPRRAQDDRVGIVIFSAESIVGSVGVKLDYAAAQRLVEPVVAGRPCATAPPSAQVSRPDSRREGFHVARQGPILLTEAEQLRRRAAIRCWPNRKALACACNDRRGRGAFRARTWTRRCCGRMSEMTGSLFRASDETALRDVYREIQTLGRRGSAPRGHLDGGRVASLRCGWCSLLALQFLLALTVFRRTPCDPFVGFARPRAAAPRRPAAPGDSGGVRAPRTEPRTPIVRRRAGARVPQRIPLVAEAALVIVAPGAS